MSKDPKEIVRTGYNKVSEAYRGDEPTEEEAAKYAEWVGILTQRLADGARVLELGCGCGVPATQLLARHSDVVACDLSEAQIERGRRLVPGAEFLCADMMDLTFPNSSFDAVVALYSIIHVPLEEQSILFRHIAEWLCPGGLFLGTVGHTAWTGFEDNWLGVSGAAMYWSHEDADTYVRWLSAAGLQTIVRELVPEGNGGHTLLLAEKSVTTDPKTGTK